MILRISTCITALILSVLSASDNDGIEDIKETQRFRRNAFNDNARNRRNNKKRYIVTDLVRKNHHDLKEVTSRINALEDSESRFNDQLEGIVKLSESLRSQQLVGRISQLENQFRQFEEYRKRSEEENFVWVGEMESKKFFDQIYEFFFRKIFVQKNFPPPNLSKNFPQQQPHQPRRPSQRRCHQFNVRS